MKKVIALIKANGPLFYFVNEIHRHHPIHTVIIEDKYHGKSSVLRRMQAKMALGNQMPEQAHAVVRIKTKKAVELHNRFFGSDWVDLASSIKVIYCKNINDDHVVELLEREKPDLLLDHGTSIVKDTIIQKAPLTLNLHWGLSPYYRGTHCTEWALINWDPYNIGVTIHKLHRKIDGGDILGQARIELEPDDTVNSINMKLSLAGTKILKGMLSDWSAGHEFEFQKQDHRIGLLTLNRQWSRRLRDEIQRIEQQSVMVRMLKSPARSHKLPITVYEADNS